MGVPLSVNGELTLEQLWADNKMDEICTKDVLWESDRTSKIQRTLTPADEEICRVAQNPQALSDNERNQSKETLL
jgi:hypothetical protein